MISKSWFLRWEERETDKDPDENGNPDSGSNLFPGICFDLSLAVGTRRNHRIGA